MQRTDVRARHNRQTQPRVTPQVRVRGAAAGWRQCGVVLGREWGGGGRPKFGYVGVCNEGLVCDVGGICEVGGRLLFL